MAGEEAVKEGGEEGSAGQQPGGEAGVYTFLLAQGVCALGVGQ
jgi:hypothetical protein